MTELFLTANGHHGRITTSAKVAEGVDKEKQVSRKEKIIYCIL